MKKYSKMTFAALSAIALNFSCLAKAPLQRNILLRHSHSGIRTHNNIHDHSLTPLNSREQISLLKRAISASNGTLVENILTGHIGKIGRRYFRTQGGIRLFVRMSDQQFEELQLFSLDDLGLPDHSNDSIYAKREIFELITAKFYEVTNNKEQAIKTTASKVYHNLDSFGVEELGELIDLPPSPDSKKAFVKQFLNDAKQDNNIDAYNFIFSALETLFEINIFTNQPWLQSFISEYLERALCNTNVNLIPIYFIKEVAPDLYNEKFPTFLKRCITDDAPYEVIGTLLPLDENNPCNALRLSSEYLNLALEGYHGIEIISYHIASYTDTSSDLTDVARTLANFPQEKRQEALENIKDANSVLHDLLLEKLQSLRH